MNQILDAISGAFGTFFADPTIQLILRAIGFYIVFIWLATAYYAYRDMSHRTTNPIAPYLAAALIILFTPILFVFAFVLYRILRPQETVADAQERALAEEAMLVEVERQAHCANCGRAVHADWIICPTCRNRLRRFCPNCSNLVELDWSLCPWCGKDFERPEQLPERVRAGRPVRPGTVPAGSVTTAQVLAAASAAAPRTTAPAPAAPVAAPLRRRRPDRAGHARRGQAGRAARRGGAARDQPGPRAIDGGHDGGPGGRAASDRGRAAGRGRASDVAGHARGGQAGDARGPDRAGPCATPQGRRGRAGST